MLSYLFKDHFLQQILIIHMLLQSRNVHKKWFHVDTTTLGADVQRVFRECDTSYADSNVS